MEAVICHGLSKLYGSFLALENLNLQVKEKALFGFPGPNGATTLRILVGP